MTGGNAVGGVFDGEPLLPQTTHQVVGDVRFVLNNKKPNPHIPPMLADAWFSKLGDL